MSEIEGRLLQAKGLVHEQPDEAAYILNQILNEEFDSIHAQQALFMLGYIMMECERYGLAYHLYERCAQLNPNISDIYSNMGMCLEEFDIQKAKKMFRKAYKIKPTNANAYANEGLLHLQTANPQKCIELSEKALSLKPDLRSALHNKGLAKLMLRDWSGWEEYKDTLGVKHREIASYGLPEWNGEKGKRVLVYGEQGVGDEIMFASCLEDMAKDCDIALDCDARLLQLFDRSFNMPVYGNRFNDNKAALEFKPEYQCAIGQLPYYYRLNGEYPGKPYLKPNPERCTQWRALFDTFEGKKIGLAWSGGLPNTGQSRRSIDIADIEQLLDDNTYISLEYKELTKHPKIKSYEETLKGNDIDLLAPLIAELDLVITACTSVVYVAGALGVPCHVLVPYEAGYRYHIEGDTFPWYDSVKLFRQNKNESWRNMIRRYREEV